MSETAAHHRPAPLPFGCGVFALLAAGSFAAMVGGVFILIRIALCIGRLLGWWGGGGGAAVRPDAASSGGAGAGLSPEQRAGIDALRSSAVRRRLGRQRAVVSALLPAHADAAPPGSSRILIRHVVMKLTPC
jgi:hypothetical protein